MSDSPSIALFKAIANTDTSTKLIFVYLQISIAGGRSATPPNCSLEYFLYTTLSLLSGAVEWALTSIFVHSLKPPQITKVKCVQAYELYMDLVRERW